MSELAKSARAAMKKKAAKLGQQSTEKVDSSDWTPAPLLNADKKTGLKPISRRAFKSGGKVEGNAGPVRADKMPRKGKPCGGSLKRQDGGSTYSAADKAKLDAMVREAQKSKDISKADRAYEGRAPEPKDLYTPEQMKRLERGYKKGGRIKKMEGGPSYGSKLRKQHLESLYPEGGNEGRFLSESDYDLKKNRVNEGTRAAMAERQRADYEKTENQTDFDKRTADTGGDYARASDRANLAKKQADWMRQTEKKVKEETGYKKGGRIGKNVGGGMDPRLNAVPTTRMKFAGAQGTPYKNGGKAHGDEAMDKALIKKMVKPSARTGKADGGDVKYLRSSDEANEKEYGKGESALDRGLRRIENDFSPAKMRKDREAMKARREADPKFRAFKERAKKRDEAESMKKAGYKDGGKVKKGKTNINIVIAQPSKGDGMPPMPPGGPMGRMPGAPMPMPVPPGAGGPGPMAAMPVPVPAPAANIPPATMQRKAGGRVSKVASSYKDMQAGAASGEGRLQKTDIASRLPKKKEDGVIETTKRGYPNKVIGATGGRTARKEGGSVKK